jgi:hypothetical protein
VDLNRPADKHGRKQPSAKNEHIISSIETDIQNPAHIEHKNNFFTHTLLDQILMFLTKDTQSSQQMEFLQNLLVNLAYSLRGPVTPLGPLIDVYGYTWANRTICQWHADTDKYVQTCSVDCRGK